MSLVRWHDLECGRYRADLPLWLDLAARFGAPILDIGAGSGRVALELARAGCEVVALDCEAELLEVLRGRADGLPVSVVQADARDFAIPQRFGLIVVPMQTIQLLGGAPGRERFLTCAARHLAPGGAIAIALADDVEPFDSSIELPLPDVEQVDGWVFSSRPVALRPVEGGLAIERLRETVAPDGGLRREQDTIVLEDLTADELVAEALSCGLGELGRERVPQTEEHVGSAVVVLGA